MSGREAFPRARRIRKRSEYLLIQARGRRLGGAHYMLFAMRSQGQPGPARVGVTVSRKVGNAVTRNRVKRWIRESFRRMRDDLPAELNLVVVARPSAASAGFALTALELASLGRQLKDRTNR